MSQVGSKVGPKIYASYDDKDKSFSVDGPLGLRADTVTQETNITTGVTLNSPGGIITTQAASTAAAAEDSFVLTNSELGGSAADPRTLVVALQDYTGAGTPFVSVSTRDETASTATITITNLHAAAALDAALKIRFWVLKEAFRAPL